MSVVRCLHEEVVGTIVGATGRRSCVSVCWKILIFGPGFNGHRVEYIYFNVHCLRNLINWILVHVWCTRCKLANRMQCFSRHKHAFLKCVFVIYAERSTISAESATTSIAINETVSPSSASRPTSASSLESTIFATANATGMINSCCLSVPAVRYSHLGFYFVVEKCCTLFT